MNAAATFNPPPLAAGSLPADVRLMHAGARALLGVAVLVLVLSGLAWLLRLPAFALRELRLEGEVAHTSVAAIQAQVLPRLRGGYFDMDLRQTRAAFEDLPWVRRAQVRRVWPRQLVVALEEYKPVAYWERGEGREPLLVDRHGEVFEVNLGDLEDEALPVLRGPNAEAAPQLWAMWQRLAPEFEALGGARLVRLALSDGGSWQARLDRAQAVIELGRGDAEELVQRTRRFVLSVPAVSAQFQQRPVQYADLRHRDGYALRLLGVGIAEPKGAARR